jgi:D-3-phosphoglycerate dehydrogenase
VGVKKLMKPKVLLTEPVLEEGIEILKRVADVYILGSTHPEDIKEAIIDADAVIVKFAKITREIIDHGHKLKVIGKHGVGVDTIDLKTAWERGIVVLNVPEASSNTCAEHTISLILALLRRIPWAHMAVISGDFSREPFLGWDVTGKTLGIIGVGRIGRLVAQKATALGMVVIAFDPFVQTAESKLDSILKFVSFDELLKESDIISIHVPLKEDTKGMIGERELMQMKPGSFLINISRAGIVNEQALAIALKTGRIAGAALDVCSMYGTELSLAVSESQNDRRSVFKELVETGKVIFTPHIAAFTRETQRRIAITICQDVADVLVGKPPRNPVLPPEAYGKN